MSSGLDRSVGWHTHTPTLAFDIIAKVVFESNKVCFRIWIQILIYLFVCDFERLDLFSIFRCLIDPLLWFCTHTLSSFILSSSSPFSRIARLTLVVIVGLFFPSFFQSAHLFGNVPIGRSIGDCRGVLVPSPSSFLFIPSSILFQLLIFFPQWIWLSLIGDRNEMVTFLFIKWWPAFFIKTIHHITRMCIECTLNGQKGASPTLCSGNRFPGLTWLTINRSTGSFVCVCLVIFTTFCGWAPLFSDIFLGRLL